MRTSGSDDPLVSGERQALVVVAVRTVARAEAGDAEEAALAAARDREAVASIVRGRCGRVVEQWGDQTLAAWGIGVTGRRMFRLAVDAVRAIVSDVEGATIGIEAGVVIVVRNSAGEISVVRGEAVGAAIGLADRAHGDMIRFGPILASLMTHPEGLPGECARVARYLGHARSVSAFGDDLALFRRLALFDGPFHTATVAAVTGVAPVEARRALDGAARKGLVVPEHSGDPPGESLHRFARPSLRSRLASGLLVRERRATSLAIARHLAGLFPQALEPARPGGRVERSHVVASRLAARIARYAEAGADDGLAAVWWRRAAECANKEARPGDAFKHLGKAWRVLARGGASWSSHEHFDVLWSSATTLGAMRGNADPDVVSLYQDCLALLSRARPDARHAKFDVLFGLQTSRLVRGEIQQAREIGQQLLATAQDVADDALGCIAHRLAGLTSFLAGEPGPAIAQYRRSLALYDPDRHGVLRHRYASDQKATALAGLAWAEAVAGRATDSTKTAAEAEAFARQTRHPHTIAHVASVLAARAQMVGHPDEAAAFAQLSHDVAEAGGLAYWAAWSDVILGWFETRTRPASGVARIEKGMADYLATGALQAMPFILLLKADAEIAHCNLAKASVTLARAERYTRAGAMAVWRSEVLRAAARVAMLVQGRSTAAGLARKAYSIAVAQDADLFCGQAVAQIAAIAGGSRGDLGRITHAVKERLV